MSEANDEKNSNKRQRIGGRQKGTPNKKTEYVQEILKKHNFCVIEAMVLVAKGDWEALGLPSAEIERQGYQGVPYIEERITMEMRLDAMKAIAPYVHPKRRAIEISTEDNSAKIILAYSEEKVKKAAQDEKEGS